MRITELVIGDVFEETVNEVEVRRVALTAPHTMETYSDSWTTVTVAESYGPGYRGEHHHSLTVPSITEVSLTT